MKKPNQTQLDRLFLKLDEVNDGNAESGLYEGYDLFETNDQAFLVHADLESGTKITHTELDGDKLDEMLNNFESDEDMKFSSDLFKQSVE